MVEHRSDAYCKHRLQPAAFGGISLEAVVDWPGHEPVWIVVRLGAINHQVLVCLPLNAIANTAAPAASADACRRLSEMLGRRQQPPAIDHQVASINRELFARQAGDAFDHRRSIGHPHQPPLVPLWSLPGGRPAARLNQIAISQAWEHRSADDDELSWRGRP